MTINQKAQQLRYAIQLFAKTLPDETVIEVATVFDEWKEDNYNYKAGDYCLLGENINGDPRIFKCLKDHLSNKKRSPAKTKSFFTEIGVAENGYPIFAQPTGLEDAYMINDKVSLNDKVYTCLQDNVLWSPDVKPELWKEEEVQMSSESQDTIEEE